MRYPVKSMAGAAAQAAYVGWHGLGGDRRCAFRVTTDTTGFPFLIASRFPPLILYQPLGLDEASEEPVPTHIRTPSGDLRELNSPELAAGIAEQSGHAVELLRLRHGIFDEGAVSVISAATIAGIGREAGMELDRRRFRANVIVETGSNQPFGEDAWVGRTLVFGSAVDGPALTVTLLDERCMMVNLDPDTARPDPRVMKTVVRLNGNKAGVYAAVVRRGRVRVGDAVWLGS